MNPVNSFILDIYGEAQKRSIDAFNAYIARRLSEVLGFDTGIFSAAGNALWDALFPHVQQAQEINRRHHLEALGQTRIDFVSLVSSFDGRLVFINDGAIELLRQEWPAWRPPFLPGELLERLDGGRTMAFKGRRIAIRAAVHEGFFCLKAKRSGPEDCLTARELECLAWVRAGKTSAEIALILDISERTANFHITNAIHKLGADSRRQAVEMAAGLGLLPD